MSAATVQSQPCRGGPQAASRAVGPHAATAPPHCLPFTPFVGALGIIRVSLLLGSVNLGAGTVLFQLLCLLPGQPPGPHLRGGTPRRGLQLDVRCYIYKWSSVPLLYDPEAALLLPPKSEVTVRLRLKTLLPPPQMLVENYQENWNQALGLYRTHLDAHRMQNMSFK